MATIGNALSGGNQRSLVGGNIRGITITDWPGGTINSITARLAGTNGDEYQACIYAPGAGGALLASSTVRTNIGAVNNYTFTFASESIPAGSHIFAIGSNAAASGDIIYDTHTYDGAFVLGAGVDPPPGTATFTADATRDYAISVDYTAGGASAPTIVDVDEDNTISVEQANVSVDITDGDNATIEVRQGDHTFEITPDSASATEVIFDMPITSTSGGTGPHKGAATVAVINDDDQEDTQAITITEAADELETLMASPSVDPEATIIVTDPPFVAGDYIRIRVLDAGFDQTDFTLNDDGTYDFTEGLNLEEVEGQHWVEATGIWSDWEPISEGVVEFESASGRTRDGRRRGMLRLIGGRG